MSEGSKEQRREEEEEEDGINLLDYLIVLAKRKKLILSITLSVAIITSIIAVSSQVSFYEAQTSILPNQEENRSLSNQFMRDFGILANMGGVNYSRQDLLVEIIKSRTFSDRMIERFNLSEKDDLEKARKKFYKSLTIDPDPTEKNRGSLLNRQQSPLTRIYVRNQDSNKAAEIANGIVDELRIFINNLAVTEASQRRLFFEEQLKHISEALIKSEEEVKLFQQKTGLIQVEGQTSMAIEKIATLQAQITAKEVELQVMKSYSTAGNPDYQRIEETIKALKKELAKLEANEGNGSNSLIPTGTIPALGLEYKRKFRDLKFNETLYDIMVKQYEIAKTDEAKNPAIIQVIDKAIPPKKKNKTRTFGGKKALTTTMLAFLFSCFLAFIIEYLERSPKNERIQILKNHLSFRKKT